MKKFNILLATDYSEASLAAERYAIQFARQTGSYLNVLHAFFPANTSSEASGVHEALRENALFENSRIRNHIHALLESLKTDHNEISFTTQAIRGDASITICEEAVKLKSDLIVMGRHGKTGLQTMMYGNTAWSVIKKTTVPVLTIPARSLYTDIHHVLFATAHDTSEMLALKYASDLAETFKARITLLHVSPNPLADDAEKKQSLDFQTAVREKIKYVNLSFDQIQSEDITAAISSYGIQHQADWIVVCPHVTAAYEKLFYPITSISKKLSQHASVPILSLPSSLHANPSLFSDVFNLDIKSDEVL